MYTVMEKAGCDDVFIAFPYDDAYCDFYGGFVEVFNGQCITVESYEELPEKYKKVEVTLHGSSCYVSAGWLIEDIVITASTVEEENGERSKYVLKKKANGKEYEVELYSAPFQEEEQKDEDV